MVLPFDSRNCSPLCRFFFSARVNRRTCAASSPPRAISMQRRRVSSRRFERTGGRKRRKRMMMITTMMTIGVAGLIDGYVFRGECRDYSRIYRGDCAGGISWLRTLSITRDRERGPSIATELVFLREKLVATFRTSPDTVIPSFP